MNKLVAAALIAALSMTGAATTTAGAAPLSLPGIAVSDSAQVIEVGHKHKFGKGHAAAGAVGFGIGLLLGSTMARQSQAAELDHDPHQLCALRYRSYNYVTKTYRGYDRRNHLCPYWHGIAY